MKVIPTLLLLTVFISCKPIHVPMYQGPKSDHFDGKKFKNIYSFQMGSMLKLMQYKLLNKRAKWPQIPDLVSAPVLEKRVTSGIRYIHINHATVLIQTAGVNIITDPVFSKRASPLSWTGPKRHRSPSVSLENLPPIDIVLISHDHYDHLDITSLQFLSNRDQPDILVGLGLENYLHQFDIKNVRAFDWGDKSSIRDLDVHFMTSIHWSNRGIHPFRTLWGSWTIQTPEKTIYFAGDTAYGPHFKAVKEKFPSIDLALIPIGAYEPRFFMKHVHMDPQEAVQAHIDLDPGASLGIHWGTFQLTEEGMFDPPVQIQNICKQLNIENFHFDILHNTYFKIP